MKPEPNYHCPACGKLSTLILGPTQAFCTNVDHCNILSFNPSLPDGGMSDIHEIHLDLTPTTKKRQE